MNNIRFDVLDDERDELTALINKCLTEFNGFDEQGFLKKLPLDAYRLPKRLASYLNDFKYDVAEEGYCVISTGLVDEANLGLTPEHWELATTNDTCMPAIMGMSLCAAILGDIYGWLTQQDGRVVHDILPIRKYEQDQLGCGSREELTWHTEDAFHELRGDYLILMCLRNNERVPTTLSKPDYSKLTSRQIDLLFEKQYIIKPDNSHQVQNASSGRTKKLGLSGLSVVDEAYSLMSRRNEAPDKLAVLFGNKSDPCLRIDPYFMDTPDTKEAVEALDALIKVVGDSLVEVPLNPGEILVVDNYEVVHGRRPFEAKYDGFDRWYKRINVIRDIRRCNQVLENKQSRVVY